MSASAPRRVAYDVLRAVYESDAYANLLLPSAIERARLSTADAALATELTYGTLRRSGTYDAVISIAADRPIHDIDPAVVDALRLGVHQLLSTRVASHAAVHESVELVRGSGRGATGFVNAVLRRISRDTPGDWMTRVEQSARSDDERLGLVYSHPVWVVRAFRRALAAEGRADELEALLTADNASPRVTMVALPGLAEVPADARHTPYSPLGFRLAGGDPESLVTGSDGRVRVQDEGSQLAALALTRAEPIRPGERWLDLCAGPGGKTAVLAAEALAGGALLEANEISPARAGLVRRAVEGVPLDVPVSEMDGLVRAAASPATYDRILVDAPCTGLGCAPPSPRGPLAQVAGRRTVAHRAADRAAHRGDRRRASGRDRRVRHVLAAPRRDGRCGRRGPPGVRRDRRGARRARRDRRHRHDRSPPSRAVRRIPPRTAVAPSAQHRRDVDLRSCDGSSAQAGSCGSSTKRMPGGSAASSASSTPIACGWLRAISLVSTSSSAPAGDFSANSRSSGEQPLGAREAQFAADADDPARRRALHSHRRVRDALVRLEQMHAEPLRERLDDGASAHAVAVPVQARAVRRDAELRRRDGEDPSADAALRRQPDPQHPFPREVVHAAARHDRDHIARDPLADHSVTGGGVHAAERECPGHDGEVADGHEHRALSEVRLHREVDGPVEHPVRAQQVAERPVAVSGASIPTGRPPRRPTATGPRRPTGSRRHGRCARRCRRRG